MEQQEHGSEGAADGAVGRAGQQVIEGSRNFDVRLPAAAGERSVRSITDAEPMALLTPMTIRPGLVDRDR